MYQIAIDKMTRTFNEKFLKNHYKTECVQNE